jgi:predicted secreted protein
MKTIKSTVTVLIIGAVLMSIDFPPNGSSLFKAEADCIDQVTATTADNGREIGIALDGVLILKLEATMGTGASWKVVRNDSQKLEQMGEPTQEPIEKEERAVNRKRVGSTEYQVFRFKALSRGVNILELQYARWWAAKPTPEEIYRLTLRIY